MDGSKNPSTSDDHRLTYPIDRNTRLLMWFCAIAFFAFAVVFAGFGLLSPSTSGDRILVIFGTVAFAAFSFLSMRATRRLATVLYPERVVSRGLFMQDALNRGDIKGYEVIPGRYGPARLRLTSRDRSHKRMYVYQFSPDDAFREWFRDIPDIRQTPEVIRRKWRVNIAVAIAFVILWSALLFLGLRQAIQQYNDFLILQSRGVAADGYVKAKSISGRSHTHYLAYTYKVNSGPTYHVLNGEIEIDVRDYQSVGVGDPIPVIYDPINREISYPNLNGILNRTNPKAYLRHSVAFYSFVTLFILVIMVGAWILDSKDFKKLLPLEGSS